MNFNWGYDNFKDEISLLKQQSRSAAEALNNVAVYKSDFPKLYDFMYKVPNPEIRQSREFQFIRLYCKGDKIPAWVLACRNHAEPILGVYFDEGAALKDLVAAEKLWESGKGEYDPDDLFIDRRDIAL